MIDSNVTTFENKVAKFFQENQSILESNYPGITLRRLDMEFQSFCEENISRRDEYIDKFLNSLRAGIPLEQITGRAYFYESEFSVDENVLIPRSETEILVDETCKLLSKSEKTDLKIADIGTGSGAIAISIARKLSETDKKVHVTGFDISEKALKVAKRNHYLLEFSLANNVEVEWKHNDRLNDIEAESFDCIVSNPPYIKTISDKEKVHHQVLKFEPHIALFIDDEKYDQWFLDFFKQVYECLKKGGIFYMEGHEDHLELQLDILKSFNFEKIEIVKDLTGAKRFLKARK